VRLLPALRVVYEPTILKEVIALCSMTLAGMQKGFGASGTLEGLLQRSAQYAEDAMTHPL